VVEQIRGVGEADALARSSVSDLRYAGHIAEASVVIVVIEMASGWRGTGIITWIERSIDNENIRPAVAVIVDHRDATACRLDDVLLRGDAAVYI
jgi:hypothetical protein